MSSPSNPNKKQLGLHSGPEQDQMEMTKDAGSPGQAQTAVQTIAAAKKVSGEVLKPTDDENPW